jgi:hypothetical protein
MDDLTFLRELAPDTPPLTAKARFTARHRLQRAVINESRRTVLRVAVAATAAAALAGTGLYGLR